MEIIQLGGSGAFLLYLWEMCCLEILDRDSEEFLDVGRSNQRFSILVHFLIYLNSFLDISYI